MFRFAQHERDKDPPVAGSTADGDHLSVGLVIVSKVMLLRFSIDNIDEELPKLVIAGASSQRFHDVELQIAAETWA